MLRVSSSLLRRHSTATNLGHLSKHRGALQEMAELRPDVNVESQHSHCFKRCRTRVSACKDLYVLALTGSIGMGKSTVAGFFRQLDVPVLDADQVVHDLYAPGGAAVEPVSANFPSALVNGGIDRASLSKCVVGDEVAMKRLEAVVHPLVAAERTAFLQQVLAWGQKLAVLDIPLLFETGADSVADGVVVVSAPAEVQRKRVMARPGMTGAKFEAILARQVPDAEKRRRATYVVDTGVPPEQTQAQVVALVQELRKCQASRHDCDVPPKVEAC